jgi:SAM-dependent methyltransferase
LGIELGVEPSLAMGQLARTKGIRVIAALAERLPLLAACFDYLLMVTTICFLDSLPAAFAEAWRVLKKDGVLLIGFIERDSELGGQYQARQRQSRFYRDADFHTLEEVLGVLRATGFDDFQFAQTLLPERDQGAAVRAGHGQGAFVVVRARKPA